MDVKLLFDIIYVSILVGGFTLLLVISDSIFNLLYLILPSFRRWWDKYCEDLPDWDEEEVN